MASSFKLGILFKKNYNKIRIYGKGDDHISRKLPRQGKSLFKSLTSTPFFDTFSRQMDNPAALCEHANAFAEIPSGSEKSENCLQIFLKSNVINAGVPSGILLLHLFPTT